MAVRGKNLRLPGVCLVAGPCCRRSSSHDVHCWTLGLHASRHCAPIPPQLCRSRAEPRVACQNAVVPSPRSCGHCAAQVAKRVAPRAAPNAWRPSASLPNALSPNASRPRAWRRRSWLPRASFPHASREAAMTSSPTCGRSKPYGKPCSSRAASKIVAGSRACPRRCARGSSSAGEPSKPVRIVACSLLASSPLETLHHLKRMASRSLVNATANVSSPC
jgi:hypothetical protein